MRSLRISEKRSSGGSGAVLPWLLCLVFAGATAYFAWLHYGGARELNEETGGNVPSTASSGVSGGEKNPAPATVASSGGVVLESKGYIVPTHQILVSPKVNGMVKTLRIHKPGQDPSEGRALEEGQRVQKGDILAILESTDYEADTARTRAMLASAKEKLEMERKNLPNEIERAQAELSEAITNRAYLKLVLDRSEKLAKTNSISPQDVEKAKSDYDAGAHRVERLQRALELISGPRAERLKVAEADVKVAEAELRKAEWRLSNCTITAPITGTILKKNVEEGNIVNPIAFNGSFSVCDMADLSDLEVDLSIQERDVSRVFQGQKCVIRAEAFPERAYEGYVSRLMPIADRAKGAVPVRVKLKVPAAEEGVYLKPEMGAVVSFYGKGEAKANESSGDNKTTDGT